MTEKTIKLHTETPTLLSEMLIRRDMITDSHFAAIGRVAANWGYFEALIDTWSIHLADVRAEIVVCFTAQIMGSRGKLDAFISLANHLGASPISLTKLNKLASDTVGLAEQRNRAVHDVWILDDPDDPKRFEATAKRKLRLGPIPVATKDLRKLADRIDDHASKFDKIAKEIFIALSSSHGKAVPGPYR